MVISPVTVVKRSASRMDSTQRSPTACRCLFGRPDPTQKLEEERMYREMESRELDRLRKKYNFNFITSTPLEGRYKWMKVEKVDSNPDFVNDSKMDKPAESKSQYKVSNFDTVNFSTTHCTTDSKLECEGTVNNSILDNTTESNFEFREENMLTDSGISLDTSSVSVKSPDDTNLLCNTVNNSISNLSEISTELSESPSQQSLLMSSTPSLPKRRRNSNLRITDYYPVCKRIRFSKKEDDQDFI